MGSYGGYLINDSGNDRLPSIEKQVQGIPRCRFRRTHIGTSLRNQTLNINAEVLKYQSLTDKIMEYRKYPSGRRGGFGFRVFR